MSRKYTNTADVMALNGEEMAEMYTNNATIKAIAEKFELSRNTTVMILCDLGFPAPDWAKEIVENRRRRLEEKKKRRTRIVESD